MSTTIEYPLQGVHFEPLTLEAGQASERDSEIQVYYASGCDLPHDGASICNSDKSLDIRGDAFRDTWGPYISLGPGKYLCRIGLRIQPSCPAPKHFEDYAMVFVDATADANTDHGIDIKKFGVKWRELCGEAAAHGGVFDRNVALTFDLGSAVTNLEVRTKIKARPCIVKYLQINRIV